MRRVTLLALFFAFISAVSNAQTVATFEDLYLSQADTFYVNYTAPGTDVGFYDGLCYFPCEYDTAYGYSFWGSGFVYSNKQDTTTSGLQNQYASSAWGGDNSNNYAVAYGQYNYIKLDGRAIDKPMDSISITNSTYAHNSMRDGDQFAKKFGGATGTDPDWFKLVITGYGADLSGLEHYKDTVEFYLADFRSANKADHYIINSWKKISLAKLTGVDSITFTLSSSDTGQYGINTPLYFCIDNVMTDESSVSVHNVPAFAAKVYPNPATNSLHVSLKDNTVQQLMVSDMSGKIVATMKADSPEMTVNTSSFAPGVYVLQLSGAGKTATVRFVKE